MVHIDVMIDCQYGMNWDRWKRFSRAVEDLGFDGLFRNDHFTGSDEPLQDALELWISLSWLADNTDRIEFGPLVTPTSFRNPVFTARMGKDVDNLSDGRLILGMGAGYLEREHEMFGFDLPDLPERFDRFEEGAHVVSELLHSVDPVSFEGEHFELNDAELLPRPERPGGTRVLVGGNGRNRTLPIAAESADLWNGFLITPSEFEALNRSLDELLEAEHKEVRRTIMNPVIFDDDQASLEAELDGRDPDELRQEGYAVGTGAEIRARIDRFEAAGADRVILQWPDETDLEGLENLADAVL